VVVAGQPARQVIRRIQVRHDNLFELCLWVRGAHALLPLSLRLHGKRFYSQRNKLFHHGSGLV
jgi:hypothetical protein